MKQKGMTLIELMIVVAIIGIISAIAYPAYQTYIENTRRTAAQGELLELAQWMEREFTVNGAYPANSASLPFRNLPNVAGSPTYYNAGLWLASASETTFQLRITPQGSQLNDDCGVLTIGHNGVKGSSSSATITCWRN